MRLGGKYTSKKFDFAKITLTKCKNQTNVIDDSIKYTSACAPKEEINDFIKNHNGKF